MKTLILTGPDNEDQSASALALKRALADRGGSSLIVDALTLLGKHVPLSRIDAMCQEALQTPRAFSFLTAGDSFLRDNKRKSIVYEVNARYAEHLRTLLREGEFDAVLCLHRYPAEAIAYLRKTLPFSARCCYVSTDYACVPFLEETALDHFFTAHGSLNEAYKKRGIAEEKLSPVGIPIPAAWLRTEERADARAMLNLPQDVPCYFIPYAEDAAEATQALLGRINGSGGRVCVVAPDGAPPRSPFVARFSKDIRVVVVSQDDPLTLYRAACDVVLCAPSGAHTTAVAITGIPLVHLPTCDPLESQTACFFTARGMSRCSTSYDEAAVLAITLAADVIARQSMRLAQQETCRADAAEKIIRWLHEGRI